MGVCFVCDVNLYGERTRVCSSVTPHSNVPYPEKIAELLGEEFVVIVTPVDNMCKRCTSLLIHLDKLENDLKLVRTAMLTYIQKKYGILPPDQPVKILDVVNGHLKTVELETGQKKIPNGLNIRDNLVYTPLKMIAKAPPADISGSGSGIGNGIGIGSGIGNGIGSGSGIGNGIGSGISNGIGSGSGSTTTTTTTTTTTKMKIYKCGFCIFQSKELGHVRFHMRSHIKKNGGEKPTANAVVATKPPTPIQQAEKNRVYRCQVCSKTFDSRMNCLVHIQIDHNQHSSSTNEGKETQGDSSATKINQESVKPVANQQVDAGDKQDNKENSGKAKPQSVSAKQGDNSQENDVTEKTEEEGSGEGMEVDKETPTFVKENSENKSGDLDIESMLAAIHNDDTVEDGKDNVV